jgi:hypothetical protein
MNALYRSARACLELDKLDEAQDAIVRAIKLDSNNPTFKQLSSEIEKQRQIVENRNKESMARNAKEVDANWTLKNALKVTTSFKLTLV